MSDNKRIAKNTMLLYFRMILTMAVSIYTSRIVLDALGVEDYGVYNIVGGVVTMFAFINGAMGAATQRFLTFEIGKNDLSELRKVFNVSRVIHALIAIIVIVLSETVGIWFLDNYLNIDPDRVNAAQFVFHFSVLSLAVTIAQTPYNSLILARERMNIYAYIGILDVLLKLLIVLLLTMISFDKLKLYGALIFIVTAFISAIYRVYVLRNFSESKFLLVKDAKLYKTILVFSSWSLFGGVAMVAKGQGISIILNIFFSTVVNAAQGVANQINSAVNAFVTNFQVASNPQIVKLYAINNLEGMYNLVIRSSKFSFYLLFIISLPVVMEIDFILNIWLKSVPEYTSIFTVLILINAWVDAVSGPIVTSINATGRIQLYQTIVGMALILNLPLSFFLFKIGLAPYYAFVVNILISICVFCIRLFFLRRLIPTFPIFRFFKESVFKNLVLIFSSVIIPIILIDNMDIGISRFSIVFITCMVTSSSVIYIYCLSNEEKGFVLKLVQSLKSKIIK